MEEYQIEKEYKMMLNENDFNTLKSNLNGLTLNDQINFYYTAKNNMGMRIRLLNNHYYFTLKHFVDNQVREYEWEIPGNSLDDPKIQQLLKELNIDHVDYLGSLRTRRYVLKFPKATLCLDENEYLGCVDYELEYELDNYLVDDFANLEKLLKQINLVYVPNKITKYTRFKNQLQKINQQPKVAILCADGLEECEALVTWDLLKRAQINAKLISVNGHKEIISTHNLTFKADGLFEEEDFNDYAAIVLPGGLLGTETLSEKTTIVNLIKQFNSEHKLIAAICAAPSILAENGLVDNLEFTVFPGCTDCKISTNEPLTIKDNIITAKALGSVFEFASAIIDYIKNRETADNVLKRIYYKD